MIKSLNCELKDVECELKMQLHYDPDCKVIAIVPIKLEVADHMSRCPAPEKCNITHVKIIFDSK